MTPYFILLFSMCLPVQSMLIPGIPNFFIPPNNPISGLIQHVMQMNNLVSHLSGDQYRGQGSSVRSNEYGFEVVIDVSNFAPDEVKVNVHNGMLIVSANHQERQHSKHEFVGRHIFRRFIIPKDADIDKMHRRFTRQGILIITIPKINEHIYDNSRNYNF